MAIDAGAQAVEPALPSAPLNIAIPGSLQSSTLNEANQNHHHRDDQENVNESAHGVRRDKTQNPEDNQNDGDGLKHFASPFLS